MIDTLINRTANAAAINAIDLKLIHRDLLHDNVVMRSRIAAGLTQEAIELLLGDLDRQARTIEQIARESKDSNAVADMADEVACATVLKRHIDTRGLAGMLNPNRWIAAWMDDRRRKRDERMRKYEARKTAPSLEPKNAA